MNYKIIKLYTEKLNISSFKNSFDEEDIESMAKFNASIFPPKKGEEYIFMMEFQLRAINKPINLDWVGIGLLKYNGDGKLTEDSLLEDENIKGFINESMEHISFLLGGKLPNIFEKRGKND